MSGDGHLVQQKFIPLLDSRLKDKSWVKLLLSKYRGDEKELQRVTIRPITLRDQLSLSFVYSYKTRDITRNFSSDDGLALIYKLLEHDFKHAHLFSVAEETSLEITKKGKVFMRSDPVALTEAPQAAAYSDGHDREKKRFVDIKRPFLHALGITDKQAVLIPAMSGKWKQINKFIEVLGQALKSADIPADKPLQVVDFGSGKGTLTFALHDYLHYTLKKTVQVTGVELREALVNLCNQTASSLKEGGLAFVCGDVKNHAPQNVDIMIALHACDTATDYAIHYGIRADAKIIMCSPCCHKQIRPQMQSPDPLKPMLQYGVHLGQEAEMVTDSLRALLLEANGYHTKVFEFISLEHTNKNKMILATKQPGVFDKNASGVTKVSEQIAALKAFYGIKEHCLESLLQA